MSHNKVVCAQSQQGSTLVGVTGHAEITLFCCRSGLHVQLWESIREGGLYPFREHALRDILRTKMPDRY